MIPFLIFADAFVLSPPMFRGDPASWVPPAFLQTVTNSEGTTVFDLMIDTSGVPVNCVITQASGIPNLDIAVCAALIRNGRFRAASDEHGSAIPSVWSDNVHWKPHGTGETRYTLPPSDLSVGMPDGATSRKSITVQTVLIINPDSSLALCSVSKPSRFDLLNSKACELVASMAKLRPIRDAAGTTVRGVRTITIMFSPKGR